MHETVAAVREHNMCISCGLCAAVCPAKCITFQHEKGMNFPAVSDECIHCGKCFAVCPGKGFSYDSDYGETFGVDGVKGIYTAFTKDEIILHNGTSGGVITQLIHSLLTDKVYQHAFVIRGYSYGRTLSTKLTSTPYELHDSQKSRYILVSHQECAEYIVNHPEEKIILVGTPCFFHGFMNMLSMFGLKRENYLLLGLFCDRTMNMNVIEYFRRKYPRMKEFYFRTKDVGGWPGGVRIVEDGGRTIDLPNRERMKVKDFFTPERCLYCLDKVNMFADISSGDNYTGNHADSNGSSSVIIRTDRGSEIWNRYSGSFEVHESTPEEIITSQHLKERRNNYYFAKLKEQTTGKVINAINFSGEVTDDMRRKYHERLSRIRLGENFVDDPEGITRNLKSKNIFSRIIRKLFCR